MITVISGSMRNGSNTLKVARQVAAMHGKLGETVTLLDIAELPAEAFQAGAYREKSPEFQAAFIDPVLQSDGVVVVLPEYNGSFPGVLKHFIDLLPFPESFDCRPVAFIGLAAGYYGALRAVEQLQLVFAYRNAHLFNLRVFIPGVHKVLAEDGTVSDADLVQRLQRQAERFQAYARALRSLN